MRKRIYISADYDYDSGDREVANFLNKWGQDDLHSLDFIDMAKVTSGSIANNPDCRPCDLKNEFNQQINQSSIVIFIVGDMTKYRTAGESCKKNNYFCTPYKQNYNGTKTCDFNKAYIYSSDSNVCPVNNYSYLRHEFEQAKKKNKKILILYNSTRYENNWLPSYMTGYEYCAFPFWLNKYTKISNYNEIKKALEE